MGFVKSMNLSIPDMKTGLRGDQLQNAKQPSIWRCLLTPVIVEKPQQIKGLRVE